MGRTMPTPVSASCSLWRPCSWTRSVATDLTTPQEGGKELMESVDLARRVVACLRWRWMDGMRALDGDRKCGFRLTENSGLPGHPDPVVDDSWTPDLSDPATLGCVLALVREAYGPSGPVLAWVAASLRLSSCDVGRPRTWSVYLGMEALVGPEMDGYPLLIGSAPTEAEALVLALEAAP